MSHPKGLEPYSTDCHAFSQCQPMLIANGIAMKQVQCFLGGVDRARSAFGKARGMIGMCVSEYDRSWCNRAELSQPVRAAIDHDTRILIVNEQRAMASVPARTDLDFTTSAEEGQLNCPNVRFHIDPQATLGSLGGGQITAVLPLVTPSRDEWTRQCGPGSAAPMRAFVDIHRAIGDMLGNLRTCQVRQRNDGNSAGESARHRNEAESSCDRRNNQNDGASERHKGGGDQHRMRAAYPGRSVSPNDEYHQDLRRNRLKEPGGAEQIWRRLEREYQNCESCHIEQRRERAHHRGESQNLAHVPGTRARNFRATNVVERNADLRQIIDQIIEQNLNRGSAAKTAGRSTPAPSTAYCRNSSSSPCAHI